MRREELESQMLLWTGSQEKGAGGGQGGWQGLEEAWGHNGVEVGALAHLWGRVAHPEVAAGKGAGVPTLQWDLLSPSLVGQS